MSQKSISHMILDVVPFKNQVQKCQLADTSIQHCTGDLSCTVRQNSRRDKT